MKSPRLPDQIFTSSSWIPKFVALGLILLPAPLTQAEVLPSWQSRGVSVDEEVWQAPGTDLRAPLPGAKDRVRLVAMPDGRPAFLVRSKSGKQVTRLDPADFANLYLETNRERPVTWRFLNITSAWGIAWVALGLAGQLLFAGRMLLQWLASERQKKSVIPVAFWWMSLIGASMLLIYFLWRRDVVGVLGQATGWWIYLRNLLLIHRHR